MSLYTWKGSGRENVIFHYCSNDCKNRLEAFADFANRNAKKFLLLLLIDILLLFLLLILALILDDKRDLPVIFGIPLLLLGLSLFKYPFPTPETSKKLGLKKVLKF